MLDHSLLQLPAPLAPADLCRVPDPKGLVLFAHPDGGRTARRAQSVLLRLQTRGLCTLDFDLLAESEAADPRLHDDVGLLASRLSLVMASLPGLLRELPLGCFATGTGCAAALMVAAQQPRAFHAVVSRSGRPDLVEHVLGDLRTPTLLIVGGSALELVDITRRAYGRLRGEKRIDLVPRATQHFLEAGTLDVAAQLAADWFESHMPAPA